MLPCLLIKMEAKMPKFIAPFKGLVEGDRYEVCFFSGDECPKNLIDEAVKVGAVAPVKTKKKAATKPKPAPKAKAATKPKPA